MTRKTIALLYLLLVAACAPLEGDRANIMCLEHGFKPGTPEISRCIAQLHDKWERDRKIQAQQAEIERIRGESTRMMK